MVLVSANNIYCTKGDTLETVLILKYPDGTIYEPEDGDELWFTVKSTYEDSLPMFKKKVSNETMTLVLESDETSILNPEDSYVFDVELRVGDYVQTVIVGNLIITNEVKDV